MTCTKCGHDISGNGKDGEVPGPEATGPEVVEAAESGDMAAEPEGTGENTSETESASESEPEAEAETPIPAEAPVEESVSEPAGDVAVTTAEESKTENGLKEASNQRKKWLEEQNKIKAELASIMSRVGKRKSPSTMFSGGSTMTDMPQGQSSSAAPYSKPVGVTPQLNPIGQTQVIPQQAVDAPESAAAPGTQEGLSDFDKKELLRELDDLRAEGYDVSRLETIIEEDPGNAWKAFSEFLDDIEKVNKQRTKLENMDTTGFAELTTKKDEILNMANNPDLLQDVMTQTDELEQQLEAEKQKQAATPAPGPAPGAEEARKIEQIEKYISAGKDALRLKDYEKALKIFTKTLELDPNNKEIQFFKKKLETKLSESPTAQAPAPGVAAAPQPSPTPVSVQPQLQGQPQVTAPTPVQVQGQAQPQPQAISTAPAPKGKKKKKKKKVASQKPTPTPSVAVAPQPTPTPTPAPVPSPANVVDDSGIEGPKTAAEYEALGFNAYINKDYPKALEFFEKVLELDPSFPNVENLKNECLIRLGRA
jgi:tetratricopeptide (TPR) repeat protein